MRGATDPRHPRAWTARLAGLRAAGWTVAVHHDYVQDGALRTFWLFTGPGGASRKGEGSGDVAALAACAHDVADGAVDPRAEAALDALRLAGWQVAIHNDFRMGGLPNAFWRLVRPRDRRYVDGEGPTDADALLACLADAGLAAA